VPHYSPQDAQAMAGADIQGFSTTALVGSQFIGVGEVADVAEVADATDAAVGATDAADGAGAADGADAAGTGPSDTTGPSDQSPANEEGEGCGPNSKKCFIGGTPVQIKGKKAKAVEKIKTGDTVVTRNPETGKTELKKVVWTYKHFVHETITAQFADVKTHKIAESLTATPEHPFFVPGRGAVPLGQLGVGTHVVTRDGPQLEIASVVKREYPQGIAVYNFEVQDDHTYFVGTICGGIWVHNICSKPGQKGIYKFFDQKKLKWYIGKSKTMATRLAAHFRSGRLANVNDAIVTVMDDMSSDQDLRNAETQEILNNGDLENLANVGYPTSPQLWNVYGISRP
jgi:hypothetical protein